MTRVTPSATPLPTRDPLWYKDAIIYQLHVKSFFDANNDGIGDFAGLIAQARLHRRARRQRDLAAAVLSLAAAATTATTSPTIAASIRTTARCADVQALHRARRTSAACASSPSW